MKKPMDCFQTPSAPGSDRAIGCPRRPLPGIALVYIAGTSWGLWLTPPALPVLVFALGILIVGFIGSLRRRRGSVAALFLALAMTGCGAAALRVSWPSPRAAAVRQLDRDTETAFRVQVIGDPVGYTTRSGRPAWSMPARILAWHDARGGTWRKGSGHLTVRWRAVAHQPPPRYGDRWQIAGMHYRAAWQPASRRSDRYWAWRTERMGSGYGYEWVARCFRWRRWAAARLAAGIRHFPERVAVVHALLLGLRQQLSPSLRDAFAITGTLHVMAISGLHIGVMTGIFIFALKCAGVSRGMWFFFLAPLSIAYTLATGARPSAVRACIMALAYWSALPLRRRPDAPSALALAALIVLVHDPRQLATPGFLFSFVLVAGLLVFFKPLHARLTRPLRARRAYELPAPPPRLRRELELAAYGLAALVSVSIIAWFMAAPLSGYFFGNLSLISLPANLLVVPLVFLIVVTGCLSLVTGSVIPVIGVVFNYTNLVWTGILLRLLPGFAELPGASVTFAFPAWAFPLWYGTLAGLGWRLRASGKPVAQA